jgi:hypothetical protein
MLALRVGRRRTAWESNNIDTIINNEFKSRGQVELEASVYLIENAETKRAVAEHCATYQLGTRGFANIDLHSDRPLVETPGDSRFAFTRTAHREIHFRDEAELRSFIAETIVPTIAARTYVVLKAEIKQYVADQKAASDQEWMTFLDENPGWPT